MPWGLERWHGGHDLHFITFSCYRRQALLSNPHRRDLFLNVLEDVRRRYQWVVIGYVVMPEHVHLLVSEPEQRPLDTAIQALKLGFSRRLLAEERRRFARVSKPARPGAPDRPSRVWQARYYDFNVCTSAKRIEKLRYMHRNPVRRGLVEVPEQWPWSSFRAYAHQESGLVSVNDWSVLMLKFVPPTGDFDVRSGTGINLLAVRSRTGTSAIGQARACGGTLSYRNRQNCKPLRRPGKGEPLASEPSI